MARCNAIPSAATWLFLLVFGSQGRCEGQQSCYATDNNPYLYFGTKTTYENVRNPPSIPKVPGCRPLQMWMVARHGAHWTNPGESTTSVNIMDLRDQILVNHEQGRGLLCPEDLSRLRFWRETIVSSREKDSLTPQGVRDSYAFGLRVRQALPDLFENTDFSKDFEIYHTQAGKTKQTAEYFTKGLFGNASEPKFPNGLGNINLLEAFENCPAWSEQYSKIQEKVDSFTKGSSLDEVYRNISLRLGFKYDLPYYAVDAMYQWCARDHSADLETKASWCAAFTDTELKVMEFLDDLQYYYKTGPGDRTGMNKKLGCPLVRDMLMRFRDIEMNPDAPRPKGVFYFGEAETVGLVASKLGLFKEPPHQSSSSNITNHRRTFRTSALLPWNGNIMAVFYQCSKGEANRVMFLVSEYVVRLPGCPSGLCPWPSLRRLVRSMESGCPLEFCTWRPYSWIPVSPQELAAFGVVVFTIFFIAYLFYAVNTLTA